MLMASGSPGSALAYQLGNSLSEADMMRRNTTTVKPTEAAKPAEAPARTLGAWLRRLIRSVRGVDLRKRDA